LNLGKKRERKTKRPKEGTSKAPADLLHHGPKARKHSTEVFEIDFQDN
jgi:hypothetical protein